jgi:hypothetical protein
MSVALQYIPAVIFMIGLPFCPETPRWLVEKGRVDQARKSLEYLREGSYSPAEVEAELAHIIENVDAYKSVDTSWKALFTQRDLFDRLWRAALLQFMAQMCGATAMKYYLPTLFAKLGIEHELTLLISGVESTLKIGCTIIEMFIIDRFGRRITILVGCTAMTFAMLVGFVHTCPSLPLNLLTFNSRSTARFPKLIQTISITLPIMHASSSSSSSPLATLWDSVQQLGYTVRRYEFPPYPGKYVLVSNKGTDIPNSIPSPRSQLRCFRRRHRIHRRCSSVASRYPKHRIQGVLHLHGH